MLPTYPIGATIPSLLIAFAQAGWISSSGKRLVRPRPKRSVSAMSRQYDLSDLEKYVFAGIATERELLLNHTLAPTFLSACPPGHITYDMLPTLLVTRVYKQLSGQEWRLCPECVVEDQELFGCGHWRREHQIASVHICTKHLIPLHDRCGNPACGKQFNALTSNRLPGQPCPSCGQSQTSAGTLQPISEGYMAYCKLFTEAIHTRIPELEPRNWQTLIDITSSLRRRDRQAYKKLVKSFLSWDSLDTISAHNVSLAHQFRPRISKVWRGDISGLMLLAAIYRSKFGVLEDAPPIKWSDLTRPPQRTFVDQRESSPAQ